MHAIDTIVDHVRGQVHVFIVAKRAIIEVNAYFLSTMMQRCLDWDIILARFLSSNKLVVHMGKAFC